MHYRVTIPSPVGPLTLLSDGTHILGLWIEGQKYHGSPLLDAAEQKDDLAVFLQVRQWLAAYFAGENPDVGSIPLAPVGSAFRQEVWGLLQTIPYGQLCTYGDLARQIATQRNKEHFSAQAVGGAVGHNPISILIPCHRVVGSDGNLTGYAGGLAVKIKLLKLEGVDCSDLYLPKESTAP